MFLTIYIPKSQHLLSQAKLVIRWQRI